MKECLLKAPCRASSRMIILGIFLLIVPFALQASGLSSPSGTIPAKDKSMESAPVQQQITVTGKVTEDNGSPLPGVSIVLAGSFKGAITDLDGKYSIEVPSPESQLEFSFVGYIKQTVVVGNQTVIDITMLAESQLLSEIVVVGYAVEQKALLTSSVGIVKSDAVKDIPLSSIDGLMQGQVSGVQITQNSGTPGGEMSVRIRGVGSISGSSQPLYVIDGIPVITGDFGQVGYEGQGTNALTDLNPNEVETISVLKDAAAASIYGARATNGVVIITTKRGRNQNTQISFNAYKGYQQVWRRLDMLNAQQWMEYRNDLLGPETYPQERMDTNKIDTDWQDIIFRTAPIENYQLSSSGGNEKTKFFMSGDYFRQQGTVIGTDYRRFSGRLNVDHNLSDKFTVGASMGLTYSTTDRVEGDQTLHGPLPNGISTPAVYPVYNRDGSYNQEGPYSNAVSIANEAINKNFSFRSIGNAFVDYKILPHLSISSKWGLDFLNFREHAYESTKTVQGAKYNGLGFETYSNVLSVVSENLLKYQASYGNNNLEVIAGYSFEQYHHYSSFIRGQDFADENLQYLNTASTIVSASTEALATGIRSWISRVNYNFNNKYIATFSGRIDGSSKFGENKRNGFFPALSVAWRLGEENFLDFLPAVSELKIRSSYGLTGNDDIPPFRYAELYGVTAYGGKSGIYPSSIPNPDLKWESTAQFDLGFDIGLFDNRILFNADYYNKQTKDLLLDRPLPGSSGFSTITENIGRVENKGVEFSIASGYQFGKLSWNTQFNFSANRNKVLELYNNQPIDDIGRGKNRVMVGQPIGVFYSYKWLGVDPSTGDVVYADPDKDNKITSADRMVIGNPHPDFIGGLTNTFAYMGFDLNIFLQFSYGNDVLNGSRLYLESLQGGDNQVAAVTRRWKKPGDITDIPRATSDATKAIENKRVSSRFLEDGSYLRVKNVTLGYTFPAALVGKMKINSLRVYFTGQNLLTFTNYSGLDPEVNYLGNDNTVIGTDFFTYPQSRSFNLGVNLKF